MISSPVGWHPSSIKLSNVRWLNTHTRCIVSGVVSVAIGWRARLMHAIVHVTCWYPGRTMLHKSSAFRSTANQDDVPTLYYPSIIASISFSLPARLRRRTKERKKKREKREKFKLNQSISPRPFIGVKERYCSSSVAYVPIHMIIVVDEEEEGGRRAKREREKYIVLRIHWWISINLSSHVDRERGWWLLLKTIERIIRLR